MRLAAHLPWTLLIVVVSIASLLNVVAAAGNEERRLPDTINVAERSAFSLAHDDRQQQQQREAIREERPQNVIYSFIEGLKENVYVKDFMKLMEYFTNDNGDAQPMIRDSAKVKLPLAQDDAPIYQKKSFETSLSLDETPETALKNDDIRSQDFSSILFGERGVLTGIFRLMDQQKKQSLSKVQSDSKIGGNFDFQKIFDDLLVGSEKGELGETGQALPEAISFLGICNRLSCGDIYKAIDQFRKSEFFSNFQTALTLMQDPNGWETLGKLLSNPELISQFTGGGEMSEVFGSALGVAKKETEQNKDKNKGLVPEDGDFGTDFSEIKRGLNKADKGNETMPDIDFSIDGNRGRQAKSGSGSEDYYSEVAKVPASGEDADLVDYEVHIDETMPETQTSTVSTVATSQFTTTTPIAPSLTSTTQFLIIEPATMIVEKKEDQLPPISFSIDKDFDEILEEGDVETAVIDQLPPSTKIESSIDSGPRSIVKTDETVVRQHKAAGRFGARATTLTFLLPKRRAIMMTTIRPIIRRPSTIPSIQSLLPRQEGSTKIPRLLMSTHKNIPPSSTTIATTKTTKHHTFSTTTMNLRTLSTRRPISTKFTTSTSPTTTKRNFRKDSDYYAMYYDSN